MHAAAHQSTFVSSAPTKPNVSPSDNREGFVFSHTSWHLITGRVHASFICTITDLIAFGRQNYYVASLKKHGSVIMLTNQGDGGSGSEDESSATRAKPPNITCDC